MATEDVDNKAEETANPHETAKKTTRRKTPAKKAEAAPAVENFADAEKSREERLAELGAQVGERVFTFPVEKASFNESMQLSMDFVRENLKAGQTFSINPHRNAFFFLPECGISLNTTDYTWTYEAGSLAPDQIGYLLHAIRACDILIGDIEIKQNVKTPAESEVDCASVLSRPMDAIREEVKAILAKRQTVKNDGTIISPGIDLKALLKYETSNENRKSIVQLLNTALNRIGGMVEFLDQFSEEEDVGARKIAPIPSQGKDFVNRVM